MLSRTVGLVFLLGFLPFQTVSAADVVRISKAQQSVSGLKVSTVTPLQLSNGAKAVLKLNGLVVLPPQAQEVVSSPVAGFVQSVWVGPTDVLRAGQRVAQVYSTQVMETQKEFIQADVQERQALDRLQRSERLFSEGIIAESRVREDRYTYTQAKAASQERRQTLQLQGISESRLKQLGSQPALQTQVDISTAKAGTVMEVLVSPGQRVEAGAPILKLARQGVLALELQATSTQGQQIKAGDLVTLADCQQKGKVRGLGTMVRGGNQAVTVHVDIPGNCLRPNQMVEAELQTQAAVQAAMSVPLEAIFQHNSKDYVFVKAEQGFVVTPVKVLSREGSSALLAKGLAPDAEVLIQGIAMVKGVWLGMGEPVNDVPGAKP